MLYSEFPRSGERISRLGFGAMGLAGWFGDQSEQEHIDSLHRAMGLGVNFVDTARAYGASERILGLALKQWSGRRPFLATKIEGLAGNTQWAYPPSVESTFPSDHITADAERSLKALGVEQVDLMQLHIYWPLWGTGGYWMDELERASLERPPATRLPTNPAKSGPFAARTLSAMPRRHFASER